IYCLYGLAIAIFAPWFPHVLAAQVVSAVTVAALGALAIALLWDRRTRLPIPLLYVWLGAVWLLTIGLASPPLYAWLPPPWQYNLGAHAALFVAAVALQVAVTGHIWSYGTNLAAWGSKLGISDPVGGLTRTAHWLTAANSVLTSIVCITSCH